VQIRQRVDGGSAHRTPCDRIVHHGRRFLRADDDASPAFHGVEHRPDHRRVFAERVRLRCEREHAVHRRQPSEFARHVVRGRRHRAEWRASHDDVAAGEPDQVGQVGMAAGKLRDLERGGEIESWNLVRGQMLPQPFDQPRPIELLAWPDRANVV
jgi:hypothetical protein